MCVECFDLPLNERKYLEMERERERVGGCCRRRPNYKFPMLASCGTFFSRTALSFLSLPRANFPPTDLSFSYIETGYGREFVVITCSWGDQFETKFSINEET